MRVWVRGVIAAACAPIVSLFLWSPSNQIHAQTVSPPNIVVIITDDMRADQMDTMPTVMADLVGHGRSFERAFSVGPLCCPSRASFLRGQYAHTHSLYGTINSTNPSSPYYRYSGGRWAKLVGLDRTSIALWLDQRGYFTAEAGKFINGYAGTKAPPGWDLWRQKKGNYTNFQVVVDGTWVQYGSNDYEVDVVTQYAVDAIQRSGTRPLFLWTAYFAPHSPWLAPPRYDTDHEAPICANEDIRGLPNFNEAKYDSDGMADKPRWIKNKGPLGSSSEIELGVTRMKKSCRTLLAVDDGIRSILQALEAKDPGLDNTVIVFTSDQGVQNGQHQHVAKKVPYEETIRIPFVIRADALLGGSATTDTSNLILNIDVAPTLLELGGASPADVSATLPGCPDSNDIFEERCTQRGGGFDGTSFAPLLWGGTYAAREDFLIEHWDPLEKTSQGKDVPAYCGVRSRTAKLVRHDRGAGADWEGYDLTADPFELHSLVYSTSSGVPQFRPGGQELFDALFPRLQELCDPPPPQYSPVSSS